MTNTLIDNTNESLKLVNTIKNCITESKCKNIKIATGYWDIPGTVLVYQELKDFLEKEGTTLQLLIGADPVVRTNQLANPIHKDAKFPQDYIKRDIHTLDVKEEYVNVIQLLKEYCQENEKDSKLQIRIYKKDAEGDVQFFHAKCYIFCGQNYAVGIIGSSNFTQKGLVGNSELNYLETDTTRVTAVPNNYSYTKGHINWFDEKWNLSLPWNKTFLEEIIKGAPVTMKAEEKEAEDKNKLTPYELYIKLLQYKFGDIVDKNLGEQLESYLPSKMTTLNYQIEAVKRCISIMHEHGGFMLSDVVGLGKTIIAVLLIRRFLTVPEDDGRKREVLIVTPPAIKTAWIKTVSDFDEEETEKITPNIHYITTGSIGHLIDDADDEDDSENDSEEFESQLDYRNYGMIIIDESHKFRNSETNMYHALDDLISQIGAKMGVYPYIGLLSATPQNNKPNDLKNQIYLFERNHNDSTLKKAESGNVERYFAQVNRIYDKLIKAIPDETEEHKKGREQQLKELSLDIRNKVLDDILERRTRTDVMKYYPNDIEKQHLVFPDIKGPITLKYEMDNELAHLFADTMTLIAPSEEEKKQSVNYLGYYRYRAIQYFQKDTDKDKYSGRGSRDSGKIADQLANIMQILLVKRLESSFVAFTTSLCNLRKYTENMIKMWENNTIFICPQIDVNNELDYEAKSKKLGKKVTFADCVKDIRNGINRLDKNGKNGKKQNAEYTRDDFKPDKSNKQYIDLLKTDYDLITKLYDRWAKNSEDPKFEKFKEDLKPKIFNKKTNTSGKLVIFSEAIDTVLSLERAVRNKGFAPLVITAANRKIMETTITENFDANYEGEWKNDYQIIITTDVLAEGINLHRANVILNYDTPWNSTKLMQRIGRVNRIGSKEPCVYVYNFMPSAQGDAEIQLVRKAHTKLQSFHTLFGEDSKIFSEDESVSHYALKKMGDGEESPMEKYVFELKQFKEENPKRYKQIEDTTDGWLIASNTDGDAYFIVKSQGSASLSIRIPHDRSEQPKIISNIDMIDAIHVDKTTPTMPLPDNWNQLSADALRTYNQYFVRINKSRSGDKQSQAMTIIKHLYDRNNISSDSKRILSDAMKLVRNGQIDIIRKMIKIGEDIETSDDKLFELNQENIDMILQKEIGKLVARVEAKLGKPSIILGTCK